MSLGRVAASGAAWNIAVNLGSQVSTFVVFLVLARLLPPDAIGTVAAANAILSLLWIFVDQGYATALVRRESVNPVILSTAFWVMTSTTLITIGGVMLVAPVVGRSYGAPELGDILQWLVWAMALPALGAVHGSLLLRDLRFREYALRRLASVLAGGVAGVALAYAGFGIWSLVIKQLVEAFVDLGLVWWVVRWRPRLSFAWNEAKELFGFGSSIAGANLISFSVRRSDEFLVAYLLGSTALGFYAVAQRAIIVLNEVCIGAALRTAVPLLSKIQQDPERLRRACLRAFRYSLVLVMPAFAGVALTAGDIIAVLFGAKWAASSAALQVLAVASVINTLSLLVDAVLTAMGYPQRVLGLSLVRGVLTVGGTLFAARFGIVGVAAVSVFKAVVFAPVGFAVLRRIGGVPLDELLRAAWAPFAGCAAMAATLLSIDGLMVSWPALLRLIAEVVAGAGAYTAVVWVLARTTCDELMALVLRRRSGPVVQPSG